MIGPRIDSESDGVIGLGAIGIGVACGVGELGTGDRDDAIGGAVCCWREGCGIGGAGTGEVGEGATGNGDIGFNEVG